MLWESMMKIIMVMKMNKCFKYLLFHLYYYELIIIMD